MDRPWLPLSWPTRRSAAPGLIRMGWSMAHSRTFVLRPEMNKEVWKSGEGGQERQIGRQTRYWLVSYYCRVLGKKDNEYPKFEDPWTPENGALTASNKLQRRVIKRPYGEATGKFRVEGQGHPAVTYDARAPSPCAPGVLGRPWGAQSGHATFDTWDSCGFGAVFVVAEEALALPRSRLCGAAVGWQLRLARARARGSPPPGPPREPRRLARRADRRPAGAPRSSRGGELP